MYNAFCGDSTPPSELDIETCNAPVLAQAAIHGLAKLHGARRSRHCIVPLGQQDAANQSRHCARYNAPPRPAHQLKRSRPVGQPAKAHLPPTYVAARASDDG